MHAKIVPATLLLLLLFLAARSTSAADGNHPPASAAQPAAFSADNFDWRDIVPYLFDAAALPGEQGIQAVLENSKVLRLYVGNVVRAECSPHKGPCATTADSSTLDKEVSKRIDEIVQEGMLHQHKSAIVDYQLTRQPFPFSEIAAIKSEKNQETYFMLALTGRSYTVTQLQAKYGAPYDTDIVQWYSVFKYRLDSPHYTSKAVFEVDPVDGAVLKVAISLKLKKAKKEKNLP
ncbi:MAG: hypothetical protein WB711_19025 [Terriglobales bacterium]